MATRTHLSSTTDSSGNYREEGGISVVKFIRVENGTSYGAPTRSRLRTFPVFVREHLGSSSGAPTLGVVPMDNWAGLTPPCRLNTSTLSDPGWLFSLPRRSRSTRRMRHIPSSLIPGSRNPIPDFAVVWTPSLFNGLSTPMPRPIKPWRLDPGCGTPGR
jgi:hypothetical protein